jgi:hypothetical protein
MVYEATIFSVKRKERLADVPDADLNLQRNIFKYGNSSTGTGTFYRKCD